MIISAAIVSKRGEVFFSTQLPHELKADINQHANNFLIAIRREDDIESPYIESISLRYIFKQTDDLYWLLVTKIESDVLIDINLLGKFVCTIMEYGSCETNSATLTEGQRELFYRHIWRPWDESVECLLCNHAIPSRYWEREFEGRLQFLVSMRNGHVEDNDVNYFNGLIDEAWTVSVKMASKWNSIENQDDILSDLDSMCSNESRNESISEETVIEGCRLQCRLADLRLELSRIQDPYLRLFARRDLLIGSYHNPNTQISSAPSLREIGSDSQWESDFYQSSN